MATKGTQPPDDAAWAAAKKFRPDYQKSLGEYFATFDVHERGIKKWIEKARTDWISGGCPAGGPDFPPLDAPEKMLTWWQTHMERQPSAKLLAFAGKVAATADAQTAKPDAAPVSTTRTAIDISSITELDLAGAARAQRRLVAAALQAYQEALRNTTVPEATLNLLAKRYDDSIERLRKVDDSLASAEQKRGNLVHVDQVRAEIAPLLRTLASAIPAMLVEKVGVDRARALMLADQLFRDLRNSRFLAGAVPNLTPTTAAA